MKDSRLSIKPESSPFMIVEVNGSNVINGEGDWFRDVDAEYLYGISTVSELLERY